VPALGRCPAGADTAAIEPGAVGSRFAPDPWPAAGLFPRQLAALRVRDVAIGTDGSPAAIEQARTVLELAFPHADNGFPPETIAESNAQLGVVKLDAQYRQLADVVILTSLPIAGCTLAVSVVAGLNDRRRPFALLRLTGARLGTLRRVVVLESAVPLLVGAAVAMGTGFLAAFLFLRAQLGQTLQSPGWAYYVVVAAGVLAALAVLASTLPVLARITGPENARAE
jgi:predicted lysophospholipase L1 biosynthesis ABC-type transport system permease subunit